MNSTMSPLYNLRWGDYLPNMLNVFEQLLKKEEYTDVTLWLDSGQMVVKCHKIILAACSTFFEDIFSSMKTKGHANVVLTDIKYTDVKPILEFIYKGEINVTQEELQGILKTANFLKIKGLIPEYNDKYDSKFEPQVNITTCEADSNAEASDHRIPCCSHKCEERSQTENRSQLFSHNQTSWPAPMEQEQSQCYSSDTSIEGTSKRIKEEPIFEEAPAVKRMMDKHQRKRNIDNRSRPSMSCEQPPRPPSNNLVHEPRDYQDNPDNLDYYLPEYNVPDDYSKSRDQSSSKGSKKIVRQDSEKHGPGGKEWRKYKKYTPEELEAALQAMRMGLSPIAASKEFNVPSRTLYDKAKKLGIDTKELRRSCNKSAAFPIGIGRNINNRIYRRFQETNYDDLTINPVYNLKTETCDNYKTEPLEPHEPHEPPERDSIEMLAHLRPDLHIRPSTSSDNYENTAEDLSIKQETSVIQLNPKT